MKAYTVLALYKFVALSDHEALREPLLAAMHRYEIKGTLILASEGINGTFAGSQAQINLFTDYLKSLPGFADLSFKLSFNDTNPFDKAKVKLRREIVTMGVEGVNPAEETGTHLSPAAWNELIADPEVVLIDTRNDYEVVLGSFINAINPKTENFRDFPAYVAEHLLDKKDKKIAMFCTGGIRCEKSTAYLKQLGFQDVYQLDGGILNYLETIAAEQSQWQGDCFVFDNRVALDEALTSPKPGLIDKEWKNNHKKNNALES